MSAFQIGHTNCVIAGFSKRFLKDGPIDRDSGLTLGKLGNVPFYADYML